MRSDKYETIIVALFKLSCQDSSLTSFITLSTARALLAMQLIYLKNITANQ